MGNVLFHDVTTICDVASVQQSWDLVAVLSTEWYADTDALENKRFLTGNGVVTGQIVTETITYCK